MSRRQPSKFRHIFGEPAKPEGQFLDIKNPLTAGEGNYVAANTKFFAVSKSGGGGPIYLKRFDQPGRFPTNSPMLSVHSGKTWDMDFHPFITSMIATASDDSSAAVTQFPKDGLTETISTATVTLKGHLKKVTLCTWNPVADSILATGSFDKTVKLWNVETSQCVNTFKGHAENMYSVEWNYNGSMLASTSKDKNLCIYDPRDMEAAQTVQGAFENGKSNKAFWVSKFGWVGAVGFGKGAKRQLKLWDTKNLSEPIYKFDIDSAASVLMPWYDDDISVLYTAGKGEGSISYYEIRNDDRRVHMLSSYRAPEPQKGGCFIPKRACDVWKCEMARFLRLNKSSIVPVSFICPRKAGADVFQEDIYPDTLCGKAALSATEWLGGENKDPILTSMNPENRTDGDGDAVFTRKATYEELVAENETLKARVKELEEKLGITAEETPAEEKAAE